MAKCDVGKMRRGPWLGEEDEILTTIVGALGEKHWDALAKESGLRRSGKSCRLRWMNYLRPNLKHGEITHEEEHIILDLHKEWGNKWSKIAKRLPGRTDNEIKNYWRSHLKKKSEAHQECFQDANKSLKQDFSIPSLDYIIGASSMNEKDGMMVGTSSSSETLAPSSMNAFGSCSSPYENRISDWISWCCWPKHEEECMGTYPCFCQLGWSSEEDETHGVWDLWNPI